MENILLNDQEAERALEMEYNITGCLLMDTERTLKTIRNLISAEDFQNDTCRAIYLASLDLYSSGKPLDYGLIQDRAIELGYSIDLGISRQVRLCYTTTANAEANARNMHKESQNRQAAAVGLELAYRQISPLEGAGKLQEILKKQNYSAASPEEMANELADYLFREDSEPPFLSTGYCTLAAPLIIFSAVVLFMAVFTFSQRGRTSARQISQSTFPNGLLHRGNMYCISRWRCREKTSTSGESEY